MNSKNISSQSVRKTYTLIGVVLVLFSLGVLTVFGGISNQIASRYSSAINQDGGRIFLTVDLSQSVPKTLTQKSWTVVQWQSNDGTWKDVSGWQGQFNYDRDSNAFFVEWWVGNEILGEGPFRWVIYTDPSRSKWLATTKSFNLPEANQPSLVISPSFVTAAPVKPTAVASSNTAAPANNSVNSVSASVDASADDDDASTTADSETSSVDNTSTEVDGSTPTTTTQSTESGTIAGTASIATDVIPAEPEAEFYVSPNGDNSDGLTWDSAWTELNQINWDNVVPGSIVYVDGGADASQPMTYSTQLRPTVSGEPGKPIVVQLSAEAGRNGQAVFFGGNSIPLPECGQMAWDSSEILGAGSSAILFENGVSNIVVDGRKRKGIVIHGWEAGGVIFDPDRIDNGQDDNTNNITLQYMEIYNNGGFEIKDDGTSEGLFYPFHAGAGIKLSGIGHTFNFLEIHDNAGDAIQSNFTNPAGGVFNNMDDFTLSNSWLYNQRQHSGLDNSPADQLCTLDDQSGCDELGAPQMSADYLNYAESPTIRYESFNWCTHNDGIQLYSANDFNNLTIKQSIIGPNLMNALLLGDREGDNTTAWVNNLTMEDVVITRFTHAALGMKSPPGQAGQNWDLNRVTIYGHFTNTNKGTLNLNSTADQTEHSISNSTMQFGRTEFPSGNIQFENNCHSDLYSGSLEGLEENPEFEDISPFDVFANDLSVDFSTVFTDSYVAQNPNCATAVSQTSSVATLLSGFNSD